MKTFLFVLIFAAFAPLLASAQTGVACYYIAPVRDQSGKVVDCACKLHIAAGHCECIHYKTNLCSYGYPEMSCPSECTGGASPTKLAMIKATVSASPAIVTVHMKQTCYDNNVKLWTDEAARQGKSVRFVVSPDLMSNAQVKDWNKSIDKLERAIRKQESQ